MILFLHFPLPDKIDYSLYILLQYSAGNLLAIGEFLINGFQKPRLLNIFMTIQSFMIPLACFSNIFTAPAPLGGPLYLRAYGSGPVTAKVVPKCIWAAVSGGG